MEAKEVREEFESVIKKAEKEMHSMLYSVLDFNLSFSLSKKQVSLLKEIIKAMVIVDRKFFVSPRFDDNCYDDNALPIEKGQTISQPSTVARMLVLAEIEKGNNVLEIGAGSGWNAALISFLVKPGGAIAVDRIKSIVRNAEKNLKMLKKKTGEKFENLSFKAENPLDSGSNVWEKKYDRIIITAGIPRDGVQRKIEKMAYQLLNQKGLLICPFTSGPLLIYKKNKKLKKYNTKENYVFVPLLEGIEK